VPGWDLLLRSGVQEFQLTAPAERGDYVVVCTVICSEEHEGMHGARIGCRRFHRTNVLASCTLAEWLAAIASAYANIKALIVFIPLLRSHGTTTNLINVHSLTRSPQEMLKSKSMWAHQQTALSTALNTTWRFRSRPQGPGLSDRRSECSPHFCRQKGKNHRQDGNGQEDYSHHLR
jgi:hypothetical protein